VFNILAPIFGLIALAYAARKINILGPSAYVELNRCVASLALPALIFDNVAHVTPSHLNQPGFAASFGAHPLKAGDVIQRAALSAHGDGPIIEPGGPA